ncbi:MAG: hypothetical protein J0I41_15710 [Filimonas sp.]|nr:hypothetical protein [Filimonas sp.]
MGLFNLFNKKENSANSPFSQSTNNGVTLPEIPETVFIAKEAEDNKEQEDKIATPPSENGITLLFQFLEKNHEGKGYDDALMNPDNLHLQQNVESLKNDMERTMRKIKTFYEDFIREINFHIESRGRCGMIDTAEELIVKKETAENHIQKIIEIENDAKENRGLAQGVLLSYTRGFRNGLAAISHHSIMKKSF